MHVHVTAIVPVFMATSLAAAGCTHSAPGLSRQAPVVAAPTALQTDAQRRAADTLRAAHVLNRLTFGPGPGALDAVLARGVDQWVEDLLNRPPVDSLPSDVQEAFLRMTSRVTNGRIITRSAVPVRKMAAGGDSTPVRIVRAAVFIRRLDINEAEASERLVRAEFGDHQLLEVMVDFWANHFSIFGAKVNDSVALRAYMRDVIRPRALGNFRELLGAVAHSPAMLRYLDNQLSFAPPERMTLPEWCEFIGTGVRPHHARPGGMNENYARELLELHTLGVDGGYSQEDVINVARALTGWSADSGVAVATFRFFTDLHDAEPKHVLGHTLAAGRGLEDGEEVLDILAAHRSTALFIARKLVIRFVSDDPPQSLIDRAADVFTSSGGNIGLVVRTIVTSAEFNSPSNFRSKIKSPQEFILSVRRALGFQLDSVMATAGFVRSAGQPVFGRESPDGWPETGEEWLSAGGMYNRMNLVAEISSGQANGLSLLESRLWEQLRDKPLADQLEGVVRAVFGGAVSPETRSAMLTAAQLAPATDETDEALAGRRLQEMVTIALASPEFQRK